MSREAKQVRVMREAWRELLAHGQAVKAVKISPVGDLFLLTETDAGSLPSNDDGDWVSLAGEKALPRA